MSRHTRAKRAAARKERANFYYPSYPFKGDHDPVLDQIRTLHELVGEPTMASIIRGSHVTYSTLANWGLTGKDPRIRRPTFPAVKAVVRAMGGQMEITYKGKVIK